jgi:hypothetical protein
MSSKNTMNIISKMLLGMNVISMALLASEDGKITSAEMLQIFTTALQGMGYAGINLHGITFAQTADGGLDLYIPPEIVNKLHISV